MRFRSSDTERSGTGTLISLAATHKKLDLSKEFSSILITQGLISQCNIVLVDATVQMEYVLLEI